MYHFISFRQRSAAGACLAAFCEAFPVCFLEPELNQNNIFSIYNTMSALERQGTQITLTILISFNLNGFLTLCFSICVRPGAA